MPPPALPPPPPPAELPLPAPLRIDVDLGIVAWGVPMQIDPRVLPIDQLRGAGEVRITLYGPPAVLPAYAAALYRVLSWYRIGVHGWTYVAAGQPHVHARFVITQGAATPPR